MRHLKPVNQKALRIDAMYAEQDVVALQGGRGGGGRGGAPVDTTRPAIVYNPQPICAVLCGNLYNDDMILSVAHQYQIHTDWDKRHPSL